MSVGRVLVGTSGWRYAGWRGDFYPRGLPQRRELEYLAARMPTLEINGTFYSLQRPERFRQWRESAPDGFVFAVKGPRYITHMLRLRGIDDAMANFFASGVLALGPALGPVLWQLPERLPFDAEALEAFLAGLPRSTGEALAVARRHDHRVEGRSWLEIEHDRPLRHALEPRSPSFEDPALPELLRRHGVALVVADTARRWPLFDEVTSNFVYVRLHGAEELYTSGYGDTELEDWASRIRAWSRGGRDVYVYFDNDARGRAPHDALALMARLHDAGKGRS